MSTELEGMLSAAVSVGPWPVRALREILHGAGFKEWEIKQSVSSATQEGRVILVRQNFWVSPEFWKSKGDRPLFIDGHARSQLIARLSDRARPAPADTFPLKELMEGDDAERLAREYFGKNGV